MKNLNPIVCTLTNAQRLLRGQSWKRSLRRYANRFEHLPNGVFVELKSGVPLAELRKLVAAESECCRWMNLDLQENTVPPALTITADTDEGVCAVLEMTGIGARRKRTVRLSHEPERHGHTVIDHG